MSEPKLIIALDDRNPQRVLRDLSPEHCRVKVGRTLFVAKGPQAISDLHQQGWEVFLDLKFHDIPEQVAGACREATRLGIWMLNVHALGGSAMLSAAREAVWRAAEKTGKRPYLIGVTVLTSLDQEALREIGLEGRVTDQVLRLSELCHRSGLDGVVCSPHEVAAIKARLGASFLCVTPGIRTPEDASHDQKRILTPLEAALQGSDYLVVGRSITQAADPALACKQLLESLAI